MGEFHTPRPDSEPEPDESEQEFEETEAQPKKVTIKVKLIKPNTITQSDNEEEESAVEDLTFRIDENVPFRWLMIRYCDKIGFNYDFTRFEYKGTRLRDFDTPRQLSMSFFEEIFACSYKYLFGRNAVIYTTVCIRMHNARDTFLRVRPNAPLLPQIIKGLSDGGPQEKRSMCFVYDGTRLRCEDRADELCVHDGDVIDAFDYEESSSSLSILDPNRCITLEVVFPNHKIKYFTMKCSSCLSKLVTRCRDLESLSGEIALLHKWRRLEVSNTAEEAGLEDDTATLLHPGISYLVTAPLFVMSYLWYKIHPFQRFLPLDVVKDRREYCLTHTAGEMEECAICAGTHGCKIKVRNSEM